MLYNRVLGLFCAVSVSAGMPLVLQYLVSTCTPFGIRRSYFLVAKGLCWYNSKWRSSFSQPSFLSKDKDKPSAPIPGAAVPTSNTVSTTVNVSSPKKLLNRSRRNTEVTETANVGSDKGSTGKSSESEGKTSPPGTPVGQFHHLPHYYRLYEIVKGAFSNYKVRPTGNIRRFGYFIHSANGIWRWEF